MKINISRNSVKALVATIFTVFTIAGFAQSKEGEKLFKQNCGSCHNSHTDVAITGPGLKGVLDRAPKGDWLHRWILNNEKVIKSGDAYANALYTKFNKASMNVFEGQLSDAQVDEIIKFLAGPAPVKPGTPTTTTGGPSEPVAQASKIDPLYLTLGIIVILAILLGAFRSVRVSLQNSSNRAAGKAELPESSFWQEAKGWMSGHRRLVGVLCIVIGFMGMKSCWDACYNIGVYYDWRTQKGYKPEQPIKFSHKLHAGDNEIACQYCHSSVEKSRHAGIPSVNICMNCHKGIKEGPQYGDKEIAKIYQAAGFDPNNPTNWNPNDASKQNPLAWIKVHNLPDHVYFNHSQHVVVGKIECGTCHGDVKSMTVAEQKAPLTMKWCIECHRNTEVAALKENPYYERMHAALKKKYAGRYDVKFTVEKIGGLECAKCHY